MPLEINRIDTFQTRIMQSFVNLTKKSGTDYPATSVIRVTNYPGTNAEPLTSVNIYDQYALRVLTNSAPDPTYKQ
jgi:hypothetical protein